MTDAQSYCYAWPHPAVTTDVVLFSVREGALSVLLIRRGQPPFAGAFALPGGFVNIDEDLPDGAARELAEETGLTGLRLTQVGAFGRPGRDPRERVISVAYLALVPAAVVEAGPAPVAGDDADAVDWFKLAALPDLAFDHAEVIAAARARLVDSLHSPVLLRHLLTPTFSRKELRRTWAAVIDATLDKHDFQSTIEKLGWIESAGVTRKRYRRPSVPLYRWREPWAVG